MTSNLDENKETATQMDGQIQMMNQAITQLREDHSQQINGMKEFYNE